MPRTSGLMISSGARISCRRLFCDLIRSLSSFSDKLDHQTKGDRGDKPENDVRDEGNPRPLKHVSELLSTDHVVWLEGESPSGAAGTVLGPDQHGTSSERHCKATGPTYYSQSSAFGLHFHPQNVIWAANRKIRVPSRNCTAALPGQHCIAHEERFQVSHIPAMAGLCVQTNGTMKSMKGMKKEFRSLTLHALHVLHGEKDLRACIRCGTALQLSVRATGAACGIRKKAQQGLTEGLGTAFPQKGVPITGYPWWRGRGRRRGARGGWRRRGRGQTP